VQKREKMIRIKQIIWLPEIEEKLLLKHAVSAEEVEEILFDKPQIYFLENGHRDGENLYVAYGQTETGRYLTIFFILKLHAQALIISARDMDVKERKHYGKR
jgi:uncharacterized protein